MSNALTAENELINANMIAQDNDNSQLDILSANDDDSIIYLEARSKSLSCKNCGYIYASLVFKNTKYSCGKRKIEVSMIDESTGQRHKKYFDKFSKIVKEHQCESK